jgi:hypothetical protein
MVIGAALTGWRAHQIFRPVSLLRVCSGSWQKEACFWLENGNGCAAMEGGRRGIFRFFGKARLLRLHKPFDLGRAKS